MKKLMSVLVIALMLMSLSLPVFADEQDIVDIAAGNDDFSILVTALQEAELVDALKSEGPFTVFAPTNAAFEALLESLDISAEDLLNHPQLADVLLYHVVDGQVLSTDLEDGMTAETLNNESITVDLSDGVKINDSMVTTADIMATNGVIHVIDAVLIPSSFELSPESEADMPETVVDIALSSDDFSMLVSLLQKADLVTALQGDGPFTVFAPTNEAFDDLLEALDITAADLMNQPDLAKVLLYHVISGKIMSTDLADGLEADTLNETSLTFDLSDGAKVNDSNIIAADIEAGNGVVHVIDAVLIPENFNYQATEENTEIPKTGSVGLTPILLAGIMALTGAGLMKKRVK